MQIAEEDVDLYSFHNGGLPEITLDVIAGQDAQDILNHRISISGATDENLSVFITLSIEHQGQLLIMKQ